MSLNAEPSDGSHKAMEVTGGGIQTFTSLGHKEVQSYRDDFSAFLYFKLDTEAFAANKLQEDSALVLDCAGIVDTFVQTRPYAVKMVT